MNTLKWATASLVLCVALAALLIAQGQDTGSRPGPVAVNRAGSLRPNAPLLNYRFVERPAAPPGTQFDNVASIALTKDNHLLVFNRNPDRMMIEYDDNGRLVRSFNPNIARTPHGMRLDRYGNIWITDAFLNVVMKLNAKGEPLATFGVRGENGRWDNSKWNGMFNQPLDIAFDEQDNFYITQGHDGRSPPKPCSFCASYDSAQVKDELASSGQKAVLVTNPPAPIGSDPRILKFDKDGRYITSYAVAHDDGSYATVHSIVLTPEGDLYVTDRQAMRILVLSKDLRLQRVIQMSYLTCGLFIDAKGGLWLTAGRNGFIMKIDRNGTILGWIGEAGTNPDSNEMGEAHNIAVSSDLSTVFVADTVGNHVLKLRVND
jgi:hypothetical protein